jgi:hypothetical protein
MNAALTGWLLMSSMTRPYASDGVIAIYSTQAACEAKMEKNIYWANDTPTPDIKYECTGVQVDDESSLLRSTIAKLRKQG